MQKKTSKKIYNLKSQKKKLRYKSRKNNLNKRLSKKKKGNRKSYSVKKNKKKTKKKLGYKNILKGGTYTFSKDENTLDIVLPYEFNNYRMLFESLLTYEFEKYKTLFESLGLELEGLKMFKVPLLIYRCIYYLSIDENIIHPNILKNTPSPMLVGKYYDQIKHLEFTFGAFPLEEVVGKDITEILYFAVAFKIYFCLLLQKAEVFSKDKINYREKSQKDTVLKQLNDKFIYNKKIPKNFLKHFGLGLIYNKLENFLKKTFKPEEKWLLHVLFSFFAKVEDNKIYNSMDSYSIAEALMQTLKVMESVNAEELKIFIFCLIEIFKIYPNPFDLTEDILLQISEEQKIIDILESNPTKYYEFRINELETKIKQEGDAIKKFSFTSINLGINFIW